MRAWVVLASIGCGNTTSGSSPQELPATPSTPSTPATPSTAPVPGPVVATCEPNVPAAACKQRGGLRVCKAGDTDRVGEWRYAIAAPPFSIVEDLTAEKLAAAWKGDGAIKLRATAETRIALEALLGPGKLDALAVDAQKVAKPGVAESIDETHFAIVPAHELVPHYKVVTVDDKHPLDKAAGPLAVPLCGAAAKTAVRNIDPEKLTLLAMTGTTALTRYTAKLMDEKGILYPLPAVEPWLKNADFVHISNEVSFVPKCDAGTKPTMSFCSKEPYIELLEKSHANIIELTGSHIHDYGREWIDHTLAMYQQRGWVWFGGGRNQIEAHQPRIVEHAGNKLAFLGCNKPSTEHKVLTNGAGVAGCDLARLGWQIRDLRRRGYTVIVSVQHDEVYKHDPPHGLVRDLRTIAEAGPAFVMGSQAHCPHPWEVHRGAYVHYGPGNFYFDQFWHPVRDAAQDKLYIHAGKLLAVSHLYTRIEERGRPRILTERERNEFLTDMVRAHARLPRGIEPWAPPVEVPETRERPDSIVVRGVMHPVVVKVPAKLEADKKYPLVVELGGPAVAATDGAFVVTQKVRGVPRDTLAAGIRELMVAKYPIDAEQITLNTPPKPAVAKKKPKPAKSKPKP